MVYNTVPLDPEAPPDSRPPTTTRVVGVFVNAVSRLVSFIATLPQFRQLPQNDQKILLKNGVLAVLILRGTMVYDANSTLFNAQAVGAKVGMSDLRSVMTPKLMKNHQQFVERMQSLGLDKTTNMLLQMVVMFSSDLAGLTDSETISTLQVRSTGGKGKKARDHYTCLIRRYMCSIHGEESTRVLYPRMLHLLADLRTLVEDHNMNTVCFPDSDLANVAGEFSKIDLNPYPMWPDFCEKGQEHLHPRHHQHQQQLQQGQQRQAPGSWRGSEPYGAAGYSGPFFGDGRQPGPPGTDCMRLPSDGDPANCSAPDVDISAILVQNPRDPILPSD
ncbi:Nuclear receptor subfamily 1 group D member 2 [Amphibalanus amphitrite]|uniref:Nuclear receptor subfamily 1 group D member 2 n=1 Tax=Amphibalanus amphitrite TaxID=1232801 RepID=A0A6A4WRK6_AMPAM|nr:Nuclear receptor subfamily 1 group D member 2 [Amphibalanus amphitrite]